MTDGAFVVIWRHEPGDAWHVQPHVFTNAKAHELGARLVRRFGGEAWAAPVELPSEVTSDNGG